MDSRDDAYFDHEKLDVYRESIAFIAWLSTVLESTPRIGDIRDQLDRASSSIALNIAEGNGKYAPNDRCRFFDIAYGSALECSAALDVLVAGHKLSPDQVRAGKESIRRIVQMLVGLINRNPGRGYRRAGQPKTRDLSARPEPGPTPTRPRSISSDFQRQRPQ